MRASGCATWSARTSGVLRVRDIAARFGDRHMFAICRTHYADVPALAGRLEAGRAGADGGSQSSARSDPDGRSTRWRGWPSSAPAGTGPRGGGVARCVTSHRFHPLVEGLLALDRGDVATALEAASRFLRRIGEADRFERVTGLELMVRAAVAGRDARSCGRGCGGARRDRGGYSYGAAARCGVLANGRVAAAGGDAGAGLLLEDAADLFDAAGARYDAALARLELATALRSAGRASSASRADALARDVLRELGACLPEERVGELSPRETEVLQLVARGLSNDDIARELVLSVRTVERHVANIYAKIGASGRTARAIVHRLGARAQHCVVPGERLGTDTDVPPKSAQLAFPVVNAEEETRMPRASRGHRIRDDRDGGLSRGATRASRAVYSVGFESYSSDSDLAEFFRGLPDDRCQCPHWGYVVEGKLSFRYAEGEETFEAGDAYTLRLATRPICPREPRSSSSAPPTRWRRPSESWPRTCDRRASRSDPHGPDRRLRRSLDIPARVRGQEPGGRPRALLDRARRRSVAVLDARCCRARGDRVPRAVQRASPHAWRSTRVRPSRADPAGDGTERASGVARQSRRRPSTRRNRRRVRPRRHGPDGATLAIQFATQGRAWAAARRRLGLLRHHRRTGRMIEAAASPDRHAADRIRLSRSYRQRLKRRISRSSVDAELGGALFSCP